MNRLFSVFLLGVICIGVLCPSAEAGIFLTAGEIDRLVDEFIEGPELTGKVNDLARGCGLTAQLRRDLLAERRPVSCLLAFFRKRTSALARARQRVRDLPNDLQAALYRSLVGKVPVDGRTIRTAVEVAEAQLPPLPTLRFAKGTVGDTNHELKKLTDKVSELFALHALEARSRVGLLFAPRVEVIELLQKGQKEFSLRARLHWEGASQEIAVPSFVTNLGFGVAEDLASYLLAATQFYEHLENPRALDLENRMTAVHVRSLNEITGGTLDEALSEILVQLEEGWRHSYEEPSLEKGLALRHFLTAKAALLHEFSVALPQFQLWIVPPNQFNLVVRERRRALPGRVFFWGKGTDLYLFPSRLGDRSEADLAERADTFDPDLSYLFPWFTGGENVFVRSNIILSDVLAKYAQRIR